MLSGWLRSPATGCTPAGNPGPRPALISARTGCPAPASARTSSPPTLPVAPVTRIIRPPPYTQSVAVFSVRDRSLSRHATMGGRIAQGICRDDPSGLGPRRDRVRGSRMPRSSAETREHVLGVAHELFYWHGIRATGVDRVAVAAGVAPTTLYRLFASKDDLIGAYIERADGLYREWFD